MGGPSTKDYPLQYFTASAVAAVINYPLWKVSAIGQSGFKVSLATEALGGGGGASPALVRLAQRIPSGWIPYVHAFLPPYKGLPATVLGMTWARAAIFWGSDLGRDLLRTDCPHWPASVHMALPPLVVSTVVQCINMPIVRATITLQNPDLPHLHNVWQAVRYIYHSHGGLAGLWHGTSAGVLKTVPKYCTAVVVKDVMEEVVLPRVWPPSESQDQKWQALSRSALKSVTAGVAGAALTNPLDVIRNEMFKTNKGLFWTIRQLQETEPWWMTRGMTKNIVAVAIPVATTIFLTDLLIQVS